MNLTRSFLVLTSHFINPETSCFESICLKATQLTERYTGENIAKEFHNICDEFSISPSKISCITTDGASNMQKAVEIFSNDSLSSPLEPFKEATLQISTDSNVTASIILPLCTYIVINKDPTTMMTNQTHKFLTRWKNMKYIEQSVYRNLNVTDGNVPRTYGLPKIHKEGNPLRLVISCINSPLYSLANYLKNIID
ncbi:hypothetical protein ALC57_13266 [Trachymyrmex cornetzi]|uniref:Uncharacterized protein n=1 Tax=Trachymyrmex cornetzi TaxID=471704 RepID=A0A151IZK0_9HYME|nr:hypothetical protein ALC57_13266 [Trachymyrmex cornetzi]